MAGQPHSEVVVIGAGAFGGWTALNLLRRGASITLVDTWGAGNPRGTSSSQTRVLRTGYGQKTIYTSWAWRALGLWKQFEAEWRTSLFVPSGVLWLCAVENEYVRASLSAHARLQIPCERLDLTELRRRFPQFNLGGIEFAYFEPQSGFLRAHAATLAVGDAVARGGGRVLIAAAQAPAGPGPRLTRLSLAGGGHLDAGQFVFACGPWLPEVFPRLLSHRMRVTRQEEIYFGLPSGDRRYLPPALPPWIEPASDFYAIPGGDVRGLKIACDASGPLFDPTRGERISSAESIEAARRYLAQRIPVLAGAPVVDTRVCQYERSPDSHLILDRHPEYENVWLVGGGSGHGFKLGPALGEFVARLVLEPAGEAIPAEMRLEHRAFADSTTLVASRSF